MLPAFSRAAVLSPPEAPTAAMVAWAAPPVQFGLPISPLSSWQLDAKVTMFDFGVNVAGVCRMSNLVCGRGDRIRLRHAEVLQHEHLPDVKVSRPRTSDENCIAELVRSAKPSAKHVQAMQNMLTRTVAVHVRTHLPTCQHPMYAVAHVRASCYRQVRGCCARAVEDAQKGAHARVSRILK
eukprot:6185326-Pleurochrysis_carterae.AAC.1